MNAMKSLVMTIALLTMVTGAEARPSGERAARSCRIEVLHSEELPIGPLFHHTVKTHLLVNAPGTPPFETTVIRVIPWQVPPPRRGQRVRVRCDRALLDSSLF
jgi:hypothetical protein